MPFRYHPDMEERYEEWLAENCNCPLPEGECVCLEFNEWLDELRLSWEESAFDDRQQYA